MSQLFGRNFPDYSAGFSLNIPLRNRAAQADYTTAQLKTVQEIVTLTVNGTIGPAMLVSGQIYVLTLGIDVVAGVGVGLALARLRWFAAGFEPYVFILYAAPTVALVPMAFAVFGFGITAQVVIAVLISVFTIVFSVAEGARSIPTIYLDVAATYGSSEAELWRDVILPYVAGRSTTRIIEEVTLRGRS